MVTLAGVAQHAGVPASTVSHVLSGKRSVSAGTRERVEQRATDCGPGRGGSACGFCTARARAASTRCPWP